MNDLVRQHTALGDSDLEWLHLLVSEWQLLSDLSFADLVLWVPTHDGTRYVSVAQMRPNTGPTSYQDDMVGHLVPRGRRPMLDVALDEGRIVREGDPEWREEVPVRVESIPVRREGRVLGVIARNTNLLTVRTPSRLELTYLQSASDLAQMIAAGTFPFPDQQVDMDASPRAGDGLIRLDADGVVQYASPNALSAYHRLGFQADLVGHHLGTTTAELAPSRGPVDEALAKVASGWAPREFDVEGEEGSIQLRAIPLSPKGTRIGSLVLLRDVTELRRRERELITKDATIREIHHRVKNNLQTVAALLRLQARRIGSDRGREALEEAVRRVGSIAIVHETLSQNLDERVEFDEIADRVLAMVAEISPGQVVGGAPAASASWTPRWRPRCPWSSPRCCRTRWSTASGRATPAASRSRPCAAAPARRPDSWSPSRTTASVCPRTSTRSAQGTWACRSYARWWRASWAERSTWCPRRSAARRSSSTFPYAAANSRPAGRVPHAAVRTQQ